MTLSPTATPVTSGPSCVTTPARSLPSPDGNIAGKRACSEPSRIFASPGLMPAALTWTSTCPGPGGGVGTSTTFSTSTPPYRSSRTAFIAAPPSPARAIQHCPTTAPFRLCRHLRRLGARPGGGRGTLDYDCGGTMWPAAGLPGYGLPEQASALRRPYARCRHGAAPAPRLGRGGRRRPGLGHPPPDPG